MSKPDGGPAFPREEYQFDSRRGQPGMSLRDWYAGRVLVALVGSDAVGLAEAVCNGKGALAINNTAKLSYALADAMLRERDRA